MLIAPLIRTEAGGESEAIRWRELRFRTNPGVQVTHCLEKAFAAEIRQVSNIVHLGSSFSPAVQCIEAD